VSFVPQRMAEDNKAPEGFSLRRWSQRKREAARAAQEVDAPSAIADDSAPTAAPAAGTEFGAVALPRLDSSPLASPQPEMLPPVESLTFESDYSAFMQPKVEEATKRAALRKLFSDPSFNVMDGLDIYVGDYTQPDPMPEGMLGQLAGVYRMLDPLVPARGSDIDAASQAPVPAIADTAATEGANAAESVPPSASAAAELEPPAVDHARESAPEPSDVTAEPHATSKRG
jgi:Protein of unknown function (DUF3306)